MTRRTTDTKTTQVRKVLSSMPAEKRARKRAKTVLGAVIGSFGVLAATGSFVALILLIVGGGTLDKWSAGIVGVLFLGGLVMFGTGMHVMSGELVGAAWRDMASAVRSVLRKNGAGS